VGDESLGRSAVAIAPQVSAPSAAAPNTDSDSGGPDPAGSGGWPGHDAPGRSRCSCVPAIPATRGGRLIPRGGCPVGAAPGRGGWLIPGGDVPFGAARVRGRRRGLVLGGERGGGACERDRGLSQLGRVAGPGVRTPGAGRPAARPFSRSPLPPRRPAVIYTVTSGLLLRGGRRRF